MQTKAASKVSDPVPAVILSWTSLTLPQLNRSCTRACRGPRSARGPQRRRTSPEGKRRGPGCTQVRLIIFPGTCSGSLPHTSGGIWARVTSMICPPSEDNAPTLPYSPEAGRWWNISGSRLTTTKIKLGQTCSTFEVFSLEP